MKFFLVALFLVVSIASIQAVYIQYDHVDDKKQLNKANSDKVEKIAEEYFAFREISTNSGEPFKVKHEGVLCLFTTELGSRDRRVLMLQKGDGTSVADSKLNIQPPVPNFVYMELDDEVDSADVTKALADGVNFINTHLTGEPSLSSSIAAGYAAFPFSGSDNGDINGNVFFAVLYI